MKIKGKKIAGVNVETVVFPRVEGDPIVFKAAAIIDDSEFDRLVKRPEPPTITPRGGTPYPDVDDKDYLRATADYAAKRVNWLIITSVSATPDLEFEKVKINDPNTWSLFPEELKDAGLSFKEVDLLVRAVWSANAMDDKKIEEARASFLRGARSIGGQ